jgi:transposase-like protein
MISAPLVSLDRLIDNAKCFEVVRQMRWPEGPVCVACASTQVIRNGRDDTQHPRQRYICQDCGRRFDDLTGTIFAGHHQPLRVWILCLYFMGLNLSNRQIAQELMLHESDVQAMTEQLRQGVEARKPEVVLDGEVECDEVYIVAGHKGNHEAVSKKTARAGGGGFGRRGDVERWKRRNRLSSA